MAILLNLIAPRLYIRIGHDYINVYGVRIGIPQAECCLICLFVCDIYLFLAAPLSIYEFTFTHVTGRDCHFKVHCAISVIVLDI